MKIATLCPCCQYERLQHSPAVLMPFVAERVFGWSPVEITNDWDMRTLQTGHAYALCNTLHCPRCNLIFLDMRFDEDEMKRLYAGYRDEEYTQQRENYEPGYRECNARLVTARDDVAETERFLSRFLKKLDRVLDYGGGDGSHTPFGKNAQVYDIDRETAEPAGVYDLIVCAQVLEHVPYPLEVLQKIVECMDSDTVLYIEVPYEDFIIQGCAYRLKRHWHEHINFFTLDALDFLLIASGLYIEVIDSSQSRLEWNVLRIVARKVMEVN